MPCAYHSLGKGLQQHKVLMRGSQINLRPLLTALRSSSQTYLAALSCGHLEAFCFHRGHRVLALNVTLCCIVANVHVDVIFFVFSGAGGRGYVVVWEYFMWLYVSVCADENEKWVPGRTGL